MSNSYFSSIAKKVHFAATLAVARIQANLAASLQLKEGVVPFCEAILSARSTKPHSFIRSQAPRPDKAQLKSPRIKDSPRKAQAASSAKHNRESGKDSITRRAIRAK